MVVKVIQEYIDKESRLKVRAGAIITVTDDRGNELIVKGRVEKVVTIRTAIKFDFKAFIQKAIAFIKGLFK